eukprot:TRINITY_DN30952_c0_g1_i1.p1 TRINITY_DN30952_c0_g1~~TRINITY_DN30952_c0_g1_i1.p1  ORF type:complete len:204 (+),score=41.02 TRINITY_DN30952_c0_g1_i1:62-673(+)
MNPDIEISTQEYSPLKKPNDKGMAALSAGEMAKRFLLLSVGLYCIFLWGGSVVVGEAGVYLGIIIGSVMLTVLEIYVLAVFWEYEQDMKCESITVSNRLNPVLYCEAGIHLMQTGLTFYAAWYVSALLNLLFDMVTVRIMLNKGFPIDPNNLWRDMKKRRADSAKRLVLHVFWLITFVYFTVEYTAREQWAFLNGSGEEYIEA